MLDFTGLAPPIILGCIVRFRGFRKGCSVLFGLFLTGAPVISATRWFSWR